MTVNLSTLVCQLNLPEKFFHQTLSSCNFTNLWVSTRCLVLGEAAGRARLLWVRGLGAVEQMHTINSGYFRLVAFWSSSSFFVTISFGDQRCLVTRDRGEGWVSWEWAGGLDVEGLFGWSAPERGMLRVCLWARADCSADVAPRDRNLTTCKHAGLSFKLWPLKNYYKQKHGKHSIVELYCVNENAKYLYCICFVGLYGDHHFGSPATSTYCTDFCSHHISCYQRYCWEKKFY